MELLLVVIVVVFLVYFARRMDQIENQIREMREELDGLRGGGAKEPISAQASEQEDAITEPLSASVEEQQSSVFADEFSYEKAPELQREKRRPREIAREQGTEFAIGGKIFTIVGAVALLLGIGFFLRFAFEQEWLGESARVMLGVVAGFAALGVGMFFRKAYPVYGQIIAGGGLGILYLSFYAAHGFYELIPLAGSFVLMVFVVIAGAGLALWYNSPYLMGLATAGGFLTPLLFRTADPNPHALFPYIALLNLGVLAVAFQKAWQYITVLALFGTAAIFGGWLLGYEEGMFLVSLAYATLLFAIFFLTTLAHQSAKQNDDVQRESDAILLVANPALYFLAGYYLFAQTHPEGTGWFAAFLAFFYLVFGIVFRVAEKESKHFALSGQVFLSISFVLAAIAVPLILDAHWITIGWGALALALVVAGLVTRTQTARIIGTLIFIPVLLRLIFLDSAVPADADAWANMRMLTYGASAFFLFAAYGAALRLFRNIVKEQEWNIAKLEDEERSMRAFFAGAGFAVLVAGVSLELYDFQEHFWISVFWALAVLAGGAAGLVLRERILRVLAYLAVLGVGARVLFYDGYVQVAEYVPLLNERALVLLAASLSLGALALLCVKNWERLTQEERRFIVPASFFAVNGFLFWLVTAEAADYFNKQIAEGGDRASLEHMKRVAISASWTLYAIILLGIGIIGKSSMARITALCLFAVVIGKVFLYDTMYLDDFYRFISFAVLGVILLLTGYLYYRFKERIMQFIGVQDGADGGVQEEEN